MAVVGKDTPFAILEDARVGTYLTAIEGDERAPQAGQDETLVRKDRFRTMLRNEFGIFF